MVAEWFGLSGSRGGDNAFSEHAAILKAEAMGALVAQSMAQGTPRTLAVEDAAAALKISRSAAFERQKEADRLKAGFAGLKTSSATASHVQNPKSPTSRHPEKPERDNG